MISLFFLQAATPLDVTHTHITDGNGIEKTTQMYDARAICINASPLYFCMREMDKEASPLFINGSFVLFDRSTAMLITRENMMLRKGEPLRSSISNHQGFKSRRSGGSTTILSDRAALFAMFMLTKWSSIVCVTRTIALSDKAYYIQQRPPPSGKQEIKHVDYIRICSKKSFPRYHFFNTQNQRAKGWRRRIMN